ncbi:MAG: signal peptide peptidase SppA [Acidobacteriaceae bacterium]|nr:signal peptide peptidase SppA [Acidobacteriaceae bacterium]
MWKFIVGVLVGIVITVVGGLVVVFAIGRIFESKTPSVANNSVLVLQMSGEIPEAAPVDIPVPFIQSQSPPTVRDVWTSLRQAAKDSRIKAVLLQPRGLVTGWGKLQELRTEILDFKKSGKPVYAFLQSPGSHEYYLASAADKIFLSPDDSLEVRGFLLEEMYFKGTLDKLGIQVQVDHIGRYKDAGDIFTKTGMSPETREVLNQVLDQLYGDFCSTVGQARHRAADEVRGLVDNGPFVASQAKAAGLVDQLAYEDEVYGDLERRTGTKRLVKLPLRTYFRAAPGQGDRIALVVGEGDIVAGNPNNEFGGPNLISSGGFSKVLEQVRNDRGVKGVIVRIDSPGGDAVASDDILHALKLLSRAKPLIISMSDVAASGGYFMSMTGDPVIAYPDTITGSIGVLYARPVLKGLYDKLGIQEDILTRGKMADMAAATVPLSDAAREKLHEMIQTTYQQFVSKVASARRKSYDQIDQLAQGRVWMGQQALGNGLVDTLGGLDQAIALVRQRAHLYAAGETNLVLYPPRKTLFEILTQSPQSIEDAAAESRIRKALPALPSTAFLRGGMLRILPYRLSVQ